jgi:hypothetical protein
VRPMSLGDTRVSALVDEPPELICVAPTDLWIDESYQRGLSRKSARMIAAMAKDWSWAKFKPPVVTREEDGTLFAIDGQHTAIAAASRGDIPLLPVLLINAPSIEQRAASFIGHNRDRISVTALQIHRAQVAAGDVISVAIDKACSEAGATILAAPPPNGVYKPGETMALGTIRKLVEERGIKKARNVIMVCVQGHRRPISSDEIKAVDHLLHNQLPLDAADIALMLRAKGDQIIRSATMDRIGGGMKRWELVATAIRAALAEVSR